MSLNSKGSTADPSGALIARSLTAVCSHHFIMSRGYHQGIGIPTSSWPRSLIPGRVQSKSGDGLEGSIEPEGDKARFPSCLDKSAV